MDDQQTDPENVHLRFSYLTTESATHQALRGLLSLVTRHRASEVDKCVTQEAGITGRTSYRLLLLWTTTG